MEGIFNNDRRFDLDLSKGQVAEKLLATILQNPRIEVKRDSKVSVTGNLCVEYMARSKPSGISTSTADWWAFSMSGDGFHDEVIILVKKNRLLRLITGARTFKGGDKDGGLEGVAEFFLIPAVKLLMPLKGKS